MDLQEVQTEANKEYSLRFDMRSREETFQSTSETIVVEWKGASLGHFRASAAGTWTTHTVSVTGSGESDRLVFREVDGGSDGRGPLLDNISLQ